MRRSPRLLALWPGLCCLVALAACVTVPSEAPQSPARETPSRAAQPRMPSPESVVLSDHYARVERGLLALGLLRTDGGGPDTPFDADTLAENFRRIALFEEYAAQGSRMVTRESASTIHRWSEPVRIRTEFRGAIPGERQLADRRIIDDYANRLKRATRHSITTTEGSANFHVFIVDEDARRKLGPDLRRIVPNITDAVVNAVTDMPRSRYCLVLAWDPGDDGSYARAVAVIRAEHPDLLRRSCIHEELAQGLGLSNDSPAARPSIFNDDEEFGLLTTHDEALLRILYDRRLKPGMTEDEAMPIVRRIAAEIVGGPA